MNHITSPDTSDAGIERMVQALGATAPRVTPADIDASIVHTEIVKHVSHTGKVLRWAVLTTKNGYAVVGRPSVSVSAENDRAPIGESVAIENSRNELWPLLGFELATKLAAMEAVDKELDNQDWLAGTKACDLSGEGTCEACQ